ncbi:alpha/beta hydrolase family protein [Microbacteriaceae bacterium 4G12]
MEKIEGRWEGAIKIPNQSLAIIIQFSKDGGKISIPVQGLNDYPLKTVKLSGSDLFFDMNMQGQTITFNGKVNTDKISGTFVQQGQSFPFELTKASKEQTEAVETGEPVQMKLKNGTMQGLLQMPEGKGPFPVMIIIAGSGPTDKNGNSNLMPGKNNSLKMLAENLAAKGIASIRYDKRGIGQNMSLAGKEEDIRFDDFIDDATSWVQFAKADQRFSKVGIIGHSEGSLIGMVAANKAKADSFISIAGAGRTIDEVLMEQLPPQLKMEAKNILGTLKQGKQVPTVSADLQSIFRPSVQPYLISWLKYNPQEEVAKLTCPVLLLNGDRDLQVPIKDAEALHQAKNDSQLYIVKNMNHVLKEAPEDREGNIATYTNPELPLAKGLMDSIINFLK